MKLRFLIFPVAISVLALSSCGTRTLSSVDKVALEVSAMKFGHTGAELSECGLVSQLERGRSSSSSAGGTG